MSQFVRGLLFCLVVSALACDARADRLVLVAGGGTGGEGSKATQAQLHSPFGIGYDQVGNLFIVELEGGHVHKVDPRGILSTIAGNGMKGDAGDGGPASAAVFNAMHNLALAANGDLYIADTLNHRVRRIDARTGVISTFAGTGKQGFSGDGGPALAASFSGVYCIAFNPDRSRLVIADLENRRVRAIDMQTGIIDTVAGNGQKGAPADGSQARQSPLVDPRAVAADAAGNVFILERAGHALRMLDKTGRIRTIAGTGRPGGTGDGGDARQATLRGPKHLCIDRDGNVIIADTDNHVIRRFVSKTGTIERVAGTGKKGAAGLGGSPEQVELNYPHGVFVGSDGTLLIADTYNNRVLRLVRE
jgi:DNA-binding beta-propeller fold protein YncE